MLGIKKTKMARGTASRGDTLIEVLFAITVLSAAVVSSLAIMNQGTQAATQSLETTLVRQQIDAQVDTLRFLNTSYIAAYNDGYAPTTVTTPAEVYYDLINGLTVESAPEKFGAAGLTSCPAIPNDSFILSSRSARKVSYDSARFKPASTYAQVQYASSGNFDRTNGIWIEGYRSKTTAGTGYTDFHVNACWPSPGQSEPRTISTIVRLYEPR
jgi:Tfp pilus assembly protein PilV